MSIPSHTIAVTGATGFVGRHVVTQLLAAGYNVRALVRDNAKPDAALPHSPQLHLVEGTLQEATALGTLLQGCDGCVNCVGILRENGSQTFDRVHRAGTENLVAACRQAGVGRFVQISALGVGADGNCEYRTSKFKAEVAVRRSGMAWTILRPGFIVGPGSEGLRMLLGLMTGEKAPYLFIPYFRRWEFDNSMPLGPANSVDPLIQPVHVEDVALAVVKSLCTPAAEGEVFNLVGSERFSWPEFLEFLRDHSAHAVASLRPFPVPAPVAACAAELAGFIGAGQALDFDPGIATMAADDSISETQKVSQLLGMEPRAFREHYARYAGTLD